VRFNARTGESRWRPEPRPSGGWTEAPRTRCAAVPDKESVRRQTPLWQRRRSAILAAGPCSAGSRRRRSTSMLLCILLHAGIQHRDVLCRTTHRGGTPALGLHPHPRPWRLDDLGRGRAAHHPHWWPPRPCGVNDSGTRPSTASRHRPADEGTRLGDALSHRAHDPLSPDGGNGSGRGDSQAKGTESSKPSSRPAVMSHHPASRWLMRNS